VGARASSVRATLRHGDVEEVLVQRLRRDGVALAYTETDQLRVVKPVVMGHSMGGNVAFELARRGNTGVRL
jgi:pimeloyl-ACP methyl ester carboxylesterase